MAKNTKKAAAATATAETKGKGRGRKRTDLAKAGDPTSLGLTGNVRLNVGGKFTANVAALMGINNMIHAAPLRDEQTGEVMRDDQGNEIRPLRIDVRTRPERRVVQARVLKDGKTFSCNGVYIREVLNPEDEPVLDAKGNQKFKAKKDQDGKTVKDADGNTVYTDEPLMQPKSHNIVVESEADWQELVKLITDAISWAEENYDDIVAKTLAGDIKRGVGADDEDGDGDGDGETKQTRGVHDSPIFVETPPVVQTDEFTACIGHKAERTPGQRTPKQRVVHTEKTVSSATSFLSGALANLDLDDDEDDAEGESGDAATAAAASEDAPVAGSDPASAEV